MSMETDFRALLADDGPTAALVSTRIYPSTYAQGAASPAIRYTRITGAPGLHMNGGDGLVSALRQVDVRALTAASALSVRDAIVAKLHAFRGTKGTTDFRVIALQSDRGIQFDETGPDAFYTASLDLEVWSRAAS